MEARRLPRRTTPDDGGPAQPRSASQRGGLTVRDTFAITVAAQLGYDLVLRKADGAQFDQAAVGCYRFADAMMRVRKLAVLPA